MTPDELKEAMKTIRPNGPLTDEDIKKENEKLKDFNERFRLACKKLKK